AAPRRAGRAGRAWLAPSGGRRGQVAVERDLHEGDRDLGPQWPETRVEELLSDGDVGDDAVDDPVSPEPEAAPRGTLEHGRGDVVDRLEARLRVAPARRLGIEESAVLVQ